MFVVSTVELILYFMDEYNLPGWESVCASTVLTDLTAAISGANVVKNVVKVVTPFVFCYNCKY